MCWHLPLLAAICLLLTAWPREVILFFKKIRMSQPQEKSPTRSETRSEDLEEPTTFDLARHHLAHPPFANDKPTPAWLPNGNDLMAELLQSFQSEPKNLNLLMGRVSKWTDFFPSDENWMKRSMEVETKWYRGTMELADSLYDYESRFGEDKAVLTGDPSEDDMRSISNCALDLMTTRTSMGAIYFICNIARFKRSDTAREMKFGGQYVHLILLALEVHTVNIKITEGKFTQGQALAEYRKLVSRTAGLEFQPTADELADLYESDKVRLMKLDLVFTISQGACRVGVRLMRRKIPDGVDTGHVSEDSSDDEVEEATNESVSSGTRSQTNKRLAERISEVEGRLKVVEQRFNTLTTKGPRSRSSGSSTSGRKRSRSPEIKRRNFMNPRKRQGNGNGRYNKSESKIKISHLF